MLSQYTYVIMFLLRVTTPTTLPEASAGLL